MSCRFKTLKRGHYELLVIDPPWEFKTYSPRGLGKSAQRHYRCMPLEEIKALPVRALAASHCLLMLWATIPMLPQALEAMRAWGFTYKSGMVWRKTTINGHVRVSTGWRVRGAHEHVLLGTVGRPQHDPFPSIFDGLAREHSRKPEEFYRLVDQCAPGLQDRADIFACVRRRSWQSFGDELDKFKVVEGAKAA